MYFSLSFIANIGPPSKAGSAWLTENVLHCKVRVLCLLHFLAKLKTELPTIEVNISFVYSRHCVSHKLRYFMSRTLTSFVRNSARLSFPTIYHSRFVLFLLDQHRVLFCYRQTFVGPELAETPYPAAGTCPWVDDRI